MSLEIGSTMPSQDKGETVEHGRTVETAIEARAGFLDRPVLVILITSVALVVLGLVLVWLIGS